MEVQPLDVSGRPMPGAKRVEWIQGKAKPVTKWGNGIVGIAEAMYPHPDRWRLADIDAPLDRVGVREMTRAFARREALAPNCKRKWDSLLGPTNWETVAKRYKQGFLTPSAPRRFPMAPPLAVGPVRRLPTPPLRSPGSAPWRPGFV